MSFEEFEELLCAVGEAKLCEGAAEYGSDDYEVKLWRCYGNAECCQVRRLYKAITKSVQAAIEIAKLKGEKDAYFKMLTSEKIKEENE